MPGFWQERITIGTLSVPRFMAAPLDGVTDSPLRQLIREFSPDVLLFSEMRHVACVINERTGHSLKYTAQEHPLCFQVSANIERFIDEAVAKIAEHGFDMLNLNLGCPARAVVKSGSGSALMANLPQLKMVVTKLRRATEGVMPFTVKIRAGFKERNGVEVAQILEDHGAEMIAVHPRTAPEGFTSRLDFDLVKEIKERTSVPIIFSGNVNSFDRAKKTYERTGVDGFMIGRALWGCPWKIREIQEAADGRSFTVSTIEALNFAQRHLAINLDRYGPRHGLNMFKKQLPQYIRGVEGAAEMRRDLLRPQSAEEMQSELTTARHRLLGINLPPKSPELHSLSLQIPQSDSRPASL